MTPDLWAAVGAAASTLVVAVLAYLTAVVQRNTAAIGAHQEVLTGLARAAGTRTEGHAPGQGAGARAPAYPLWDQLRDPLPNGALPSWRYEECGEECAAEVIYHQHGVEVLADALRAQLGGPARRGLTTGGDLARVLARNNVPAVVEDLPAAAVAARLQALGAQGGGAIVLGHWLSSQVLHWVLVTRADERGCGANDPWGGVRRTWTWADFTAAYAGELVAITRQADPR